MIGSSLTEVCVEAADVCNLSLLQGSEVHTVCTVRPTHAHWTSCWANVCVFIVKRTQAVYSISESAIRMNMHPAAYESPSRLLQDLSAARHPGDSADHLMIFTAVDLFCKSSKAISKGFGNETSPFILPVSHRLWPIHHLVYNYRVQLPLPPSLRLCWEGGRAPHMSILRLSAEVIRGGDTQGRLIRERIKASESRLKFSLLLFS